MHRLKALDALFLYIETRETPMHVAGLTLFDLPPAHQGRFYQTYRNFIGARVPFIPLLRRMLSYTAFALDHPSWAEDEAFDLDYHVRSLTLPPPGSFAQLERAVARLHGELLDRSRPLWQFTVIEGLAGGRAALYTKLHHSGLDGISAMLLSQAMYDVTPQPRPPVLPSSAKLPEHHAARFPGLDTFLVDTLRRDIDAIHHFPDLLRAFNNLLLPKIPGDATLRDIFRRSRWPRLPPLIAPRTMLNVQITAERSYAARSLSLPAAKRIARQAGAKLNDVILTICAGALRNYLHEHDSLPRRAMNAFVPISARELGNIDMATQVTGMICTLATDIADPAERLRTIVESTQNSKRISNELKDVLTGDVSFIGAPMIVPALARLFGASHAANWTRPLCNLIISNVPGPPVPLYCAQARVCAMYPVSIPTHGMALNITVQSYLDHLDFGLIADRRALPDVDVLADYLQPCLDSLAASILPPAELHPPISSETESPETAPEIVRLRAPRKARTH